MAERSPPGRPHRAADGTAAGDTSREGATTAGQDRRTGNGPPGTQSQEGDEALPNGASRGTSDPQTSSGTVHGRPFGRQAYAALDLGTNNCRLLIARPSGENFTVIDAFSRVVRLGEGLAHSGKLSDAAMDRTLAALKVCADKLRKRNVRLARSVATEACRRASNGEAFIERVLRETGIRLDIISAQEEARLAVLGCHVLLEQGHGPALIFDIGGGSTELVLIEPGETVPRIVDWQSVPWGVVSLTDTVGADDTSNETRAARYAHMRRIVTTSFTQFAERIAPTHRANRADIRLLGTSGTVTTLASIYLDLKQYDRRKVDGLIMPSEGMREVAQRLAGLSWDERSELPIIGRERAELVVAGCAILESILDIWPADRLGVADRGIREGILRSLIASENDAEESRRTLREQQREQRAEQAETRFDRPAEQAEQGSDRKRGER